MRGETDGLLELIPWLRPLDREATHRIERSLAIVRMRRNRVIHYQADAAIEAFLVVDGIVRKEIWRSDDSVVILRENGPGTWLGAAETLAGSTYLTNATNVTEASIAAIRRNALEELIEIPVVRRELFRQIVVESADVHGLVELREPSDLILEMLSRDIKMSEQGDTLVRITQEQLASRVGLSRETVNRHLQMLAERGIVEVDRGAIRVLSTDGDGSERRDFPGASR